MNSELKKLSKRVNMNNHILFGSKQNKIGKNVSYIDRVNEVCS